jgi:DNA-binding MarR family transcriptional regulator
MAKKQSDRARVAQAFDLESSIPFMLNGLTRRFNARLERAFRCKRLGIQDWRLLATLANTPLNRPADIADYIATDPSTLSRMIDRFALAGVLVRKKPAGEARITQLELTAFGRSLYEAAFEVISHQRDVLLSSLTEREREQLTRILVKLRDNYEPSTALARFDIKTPAA